MSKVIQIVRLGDDEDGQLHLAILTDAGEVFTGWYVEPSRAYNYQKKEYDYLGDRWEWLPVELPEGVHVDG